MYTIDAVIEKYNRLYGQEVVAQAAAILAGMSLEEKVGQVLCVGIDGAELEDEAAEIIRKYALGGIILFGRNIESVEQVARLTWQIQKTAREAGHPGLFIAIDQEGGRVLRLTEAHGFTEVLSGMAAGATGDPNVAYRAGSILAQEMKMVGINLNLAPMLRIAKPQPREKGDKSRPISMLPDVVGEFGQMYVRGFQEHGVMATLKHFPGTTRHAGSGVDSHLGMACEPDTLEDLDTFAWVVHRMGLRADPACMMVTHTYWPNVETSGVLPASVSPTCYRLLRRRLGFQGLAITDSLEMGALPEAGFPVDKASAAALRAGADILLHQRNHDDHRRVIAEMLHQLECNEIPLERLDEAVLHILIYKIRWGILNVDTTEPTLRELPGLEARRQMAREDAVRAITVLKNERRLLPLKPGRPVMVIEYGPAHGTTWMPGIAQPGQIRGLGERLGARTYVLEYLDVSDEEIREICEQGRGHVVIAITSEAQESDFQQRLVKALWENIDDLVVIAMRGPYDIQAFPYVHTYVASYGFNPAHQDALVKVLTGEVKPQGKLPVDIPGQFQRGDGLVS